mgnify:CR=1 FL=1
MLGNSLPKMDEPSQSLAILLAGESSLALVSLEATTGERLGRMSLSA